MTSDRFQCVRCERTSASVFNADLCPCCKRELRREEAARAAKRQREQEARGLVGDERRAEAALADFDAMARRVREAAGVPARGGR